MATPDTSWSEILTSAGMEPGLAKAFDLIELRTPDARAVTELTVALLNMRSDVEGLKSELESVHERMTKLEEAESALVQVLGEQIIELRKMERRHETHASETKRSLEDLTTKVDALNAVVRNDRKVLEQLDAKTELIIVTQRQHSKDIANLKTDVAELKTDVAELKGDVANLKTDVAELKGDVAELKGDVAELKGDVAELKGGMTEVLAWIRTQRDAE